MRERLALTLPALAHSPASDAKACMYSTTPDEHFVIGMHPAYDNVVVACGFSGHGFKMASAIGAVATELAVDGSTTTDVGFMAADRFLAPGTRLARLALR